jgi:hypothetical protein
MQCFDYLTTLEQYVLFYSDSLSNALQVIYGCCPGSQISSRACMLALSSGELSSSKTRCADTCRDNWDSAADICCDNILQIGVCNKFPEKRARDQRHRMLCRSGRLPHFDSKTCSECETRTVFLVELMGRETPGVRGSGKGNGMKLLVIV